MGVEGGRGRWEEGVRGEEWGGRAGVEDEGVKKEGDETEIPKK